MLAARLAPLASLALALAAPACATSDAAPTAAAPTAATPDVCVAAMTRARTCTAEWIPALVDARARLDAPAGIAAAVRSDRAGVIAQANAEWATDSQDAHIAEACAHMATTVTAADRTDTTACLAAASCDAYVACEIPVFERHLAHH